MLRFSLAYLSPEQMAQVKALEDKLDNVRLLPIGKEQEIFVLEAKMGPNEWQPVHLVYPEVEGLACCYFSENDAALAKSSLKSMLRRRGPLQHRKRPIRVRKV